MTPTPNEKEAPSEGQSRAQIQGQGQILTEEKTFNFTGFFGEEENPQELYPAQICIGGGYVEEANQSSPRGDSQAAQILSQIHQGEGESPAQAVTREAREKAASLSGVCTDQRFSNGANTGWVLEPTTDIPKDEPEKLRARHSHKIGHQWGTTTEGGIIEGF